MKEKWIVVVLIVSLLGGIKMFATAKAAATDGIDGKIYKTIAVEEGDTLWGLSNAYKRDVTSQKWVDEVIFINHLNKNGDITAGENIVVPVYPLVITIQKEN